MNDLKNKKVLITPLNWGLGHATRCIPIINKLLSNNCQVILACDGAPLLLLQKEFPALKSYTLPCYNITYTKNPSLFKLKLFYKGLSLVPILKKEKKVIKEIILSEGVEVLISDNRFGVYSSSIKSIYITHQLNVKAGFYSKIATYLHSKIYKKYDEVWIPDFNNAELALAGKLSQKDIKNKIYINPISRFKKLNVEEDIDYLFLLSGPEPQRTLLENIFYKEISKEKTKSIVFVRGQLEHNEEVIFDNNVTIYNFATSSNLENLINRSKVVVCRAGYTTIMDLAYLNKKAFLIPTPGQDEQEYLATYLCNKSFFPFAKQSNFKWELLKTVDEFKGLNIKD